MPSQEAYRLCLGLLSLSREYPPSRVEACCQLANREGLVRLAAQVGADQWPRPTARKVRSVIQNCRKSTRTSAAPRASTQRGYVPWANNKRWTRLGHLTDWHGGCRCNNNWNRVPTKGCPSSSGCFLLVEHEQLEPGAA